MFGLKSQWQTFGRNLQKNVLLKLINQLELSNKAARIKAARTILYIAQGCWAEVQSDEEQLHWARNNVFLLYQCGVFHAFLELLNYEIE